MDTIGERYAAIFSAMDEGVVIQDADGRIEACNKSAERILGLTTGQVSGVTWMDPRWRAIHEDGSPFPGEAHPARLTLQTRELLSGIVMGVHRPDGTLMWISVNSWPVLRDGRLQAVVTTFTDVTRQKAAEDALRKSEEKFSKIFLSSPAAISINSFVEGISRFIDVNQTFEQITGYRREEVIGRASDDLGLWADPQERVAALRRLGANGHVRNMEHRFRKKGGEIGIGLISMELLRIDGETCAITAVTDITDRKRAHQLVEENERKYRALFETAGDGILLMLGERFVDCNARALQLYKCSREQLIGSTPVHYSPDKQPDGNLSAEKAQDLIGKALAGERQFFEWEHATADGSVFAAEVTLNPVEFGGGEHILAMVRDVSRRKQAEEALLRSEHRYRAFVANSSEAIGCVEFDPPIPLDLPEDEIIARAYRGHIVEANDALARQRGYSGASEIIGRPLAERRDPYDQLNQEMDRRIVHNGFRHTDFEARIHDEYGHVHYVAASGFGVIEEGHVLRLWVVNRDVTEQTTARQALVENEQRFRQMAENIREVFWLEDRRERRLVYISPAYELIWGQSRESLGENPEKWIEAVHPADRSELNRSRSGPDGADWEVQYRIIRPDGSIRWIDDRGFPVPDEKGEIYRFAGIAEDITERKLRDEQLRTLKDQLQRENVQLREVIESEHIDERIVGESQAIRQVLAEIETVAATGATVLILGETGTGKELVARMVHRLSRQADRLLVTVNCAALASSLIESELFGHEKGAFTGALSRRLGRFELADRGTIFLDEIGDLPLEVQAKLLRVLQQGEFERLGGTQTLQVSVRVIAATNRNLRDMVRSGEFRPDLYYRLNAFPLEVPPLRERREDIPLLVQHFLTRLSRSLGKELTSVGKESLESLLRHSWPGNVRELFHAVERAAIRSRGPVISIDDPDQGDRLSASDSLSDRLADVERDQILRVLAETHWVIEGPTGAAKRLHLHPNTLRYRLQKLNIRRPK
ncbi:MAG: PAS domain S-box protein [Bryobacteraceae bacterium]